LWHSVAFKVIFVYGYIHVPLLMHIKDYYMHDLTINQKQLTGQEVVKDLTHPLPQHAFIKHFVYMYITV
jgi:hypothetical protein